MALVSTGFNLSVTLIDVGNDPTIKSFSLRAATYAAAVTDAATIIAALTAVTNAGIASYLISEQFAENNFVPPVIAGARNSIQAIITASIASNPLKHATIVIPAPNSNLFVETTGPNSDIVDVTVANVAAYIDLFKAAGEAYISDGEDVAPVANAQGIRRTVYRRLA